MHTTHARRCPSAGVVIVAFLAASILASAFTFLIGLPCHPMHSSDLPGGSRYRCLLFFCLVLFCLAWVSGSRSLRARRAVLPRGTDVDPYRV